MTRRFTIPAAALALVLSVALIGVHAEGGRTVVLLPIVGAPLHGGVMVPPEGLHCLLQTGASIQLDPRTGKPVLSCEAKDGHGMIVWSGDRLLLDHVATGSGSLAVLDGALWVAAVRDDGAVEFQEVPTP